MSWPEPRPLCGTGKRRWPAHRTRRFFLQLLFRPMGVFEFEKFGGGTKAVMDAVVSATAKGVTTIIGTRLLPVSPLL